MSRTPSTLALATLAALGLAAHPRTAAAQGYTYQNLATFSGSGAGPSDPRARLTLLGNTLYGTTFNGGANNRGAAFSLPTAGGTPTVLASFSGTYGTGPSSLTPSADGQTLYGTTDAYGTPDTSTNGPGAVFSVPAAGGALTTLAAFNGADGYGPNGGLILSPDGTTLYGTTIGGGDQSLNSGQGYGEVFSLPVTGGAPTVLATFNGTDGANPTGGLTLVGGTLYGTTQGGGANSDGAVFSVPVAGGQITDLAAFSNASGYVPESGLTLSADGTTLFGQTPIGGANSSGTVFSVPVTGGAVTVLASLPTAPNSEDPSYRLALSADGTTLFGTTDGNRRFATQASVFSVPTAGGPLTTLTQFSFADGSLPQGGITLGPDGTLYGTITGGTNGQGNVYALVPNAAPEPSQTAALGLGLLGLAGLSLRARRRARA